MPCVALGNTSARRATLVQKRSRKTHKPKLSLTTKSHKPRIQGANISNNSAKSATSAQPQAAAIRLKDGDCVQIRPHRPQPSKVALSQVIQTTATKPSSVQPKVKDSSSKKRKHLKTKSRLAKTTTKRRSRFRRPSRAELINVESRLGSTIFGPIPAGHRREFFHDRENVWIWHESWTDSERHSRQLTVRYEVRPTGVYKKLSAGKYFRLEGAELENFRKATRAYLSLIKQHIYSVA